MSDTDDENVIKTTSSKMVTKLNGLQQFRFVANVANAKTMSTPKTIYKKIERVPGMKRIQVMADSDSDGSDIASPMKKTKIELTVEEKEERFIAIAKVASDYDTMDIQDALVRSSWEVDKAMKYLTENYTRKSQPTKSSKTTSAMNGRSQSSSKNSKYASDEDSGDKEYSKSYVYDSEDSDNELTYVMTAQRKNVLNFLNTATALELQTVKNLSEKKANAVIELRPFENWLDLCQKLAACKSLSTELLNNTQDLLNKHNNVANILTKCNKLVQRLESAIQAGAGMTEQPKLLNKKLKLADYQLIGLNWLTVMNKQKMNGILADEMGLGKTIQVIAFLAYLKENNLAKSAHLIVVPSSTLDNWAAEFARWCPHLRVERYHGSQDERRRMRSRYAKEGFSRFDVLITTYHIVSSTAEEKKMFRICKLHYVVFDEAHLLKNMTTQRYANLVNINADMRILLTGTPLQNNLLELMSLLCFVMPSIFGRNMEDIKSLFGKKSKTDGKDDVSQFQQTQIERAKRIMKPFVLRRLKKVVLKNLPKKFTYVEKIPMTETQKRYYTDLVEYYSNNKDEVCKRDRAGITIMMEMRKLANHPLLGRYYFTDDELNELAKRLAKIPAFKKSNAEYIYEDLLTMSDFKIWQLCDKYELSDVKIPDELICDSGKFKHLDVMLPKLKEEGHRVLIFSQFTIMLDIIEEYLSIRKLCYHRLDGSTAVEDRQDMINDFNNDSEVFIFLLSTKAGGVGINLTAADTCIIHDIDFNPYNDKQAEDRCHRMGQTRPVSIYRFISDGTIEEGMLMVAEEKLKLEQDITSNEKGQVEEAKCVVKLLTMALGLDKDEEELLNKSINDSLTSQNPLSENNL